MSDELQALCFAAGANSIFYGEKLLTTGNPDTERDLALFERLGLRPMQVTVDAEDHDHGGTMHAEIVETVRTCAAHPFAGSLTCPGTAGPTSRSEERRGGKECVSPR